jgi:hypothetical protein
MTYEGSIAINVEGNHLEPSRLLTRKHRFRMWPSRSGDYSHTGSRETLSIRAICAAVFRPDMTASAISRRLVSFSFLRRLPRSEHPKTFLSRHKPGIYHGQDDDSVGCPFSDGKAHTCFAPINHQQSRSSRAAARTEEH